VLLYDGSGSCEDKNCGIGGVVMSYDSISHFKDQESMVKEGMDHSEEQITVADEKITRLQEASSSLDSCLESLGNMKEDIDDFEVTKTKWQGEEEENITAKHNPYAIFLNTYESNVSKAKEQIVEDLEEAKAEKETAEIGLENLEDVLDGLESDIKLAKEDG